MAVAIEIKKLEKRYGDQIAVVPMDLTIMQGELFGLLGVNGAGKTTTLRMLSGLSRPSGGDADVLGFSVLTQAKQVKSRIGISTQETAVAPNLTVHENLAFIAGIYGMDARRAREAADQTIRQFAMDQIADTRAKTLSGGWQRRLSIAMALISKPQVLLLDEPTLGLDVLARRELWRVILALRGKITIILTTHYLEEVEALCDRVAVMVDGSIRALGTCEALCARTGQARFEDAFVAIAQGEG
jgi:ABC-2 type transport system ATP-binding protein